MKALIKDGVAVNVIAADQLSAGFHPSIADQFQTVPAEVGIGWRLIEGEWTAPEPNAAAANLPAQALVIDIPSFKMRFTPQELASIRASQDGIVMTFLSEIVDDPRTTHVNLALPFVQGAVEHLANVGLLTEARAAEILTGQGS